MNVPFVRLVVIGLLALTARLPAQDRNFHIYLCFGQSNMEGFPGIPASEKTFDDPRFQVLAAVDFPEMHRKQGQWYTAVPPLSRPPAGLSPADYFGRSLIAHLPKDIKVGVVNVAVGGCHIQLFDPVNYLEYVANAPEWMKPALHAYDNKPYERLVTMAREAKKAGVIKGILLHQGESNTGDPTWPAKVKVIYDRLLHDLDLEAADVPLLAGEMLSAEAGGKCASMNPIIATLPETIPTAHVVSSAGCAGLPDGLHFTPEGYRKLGENYAATMLSLLPASLSKSP